MKNQKIRKKLESLKTKKYKITNKIFLKLSVLISILIIIGPLVGLIIINFDKINFQHNPFNEQVVNFSEGINKKIFLKTNHEFTVSSIEGKQSYLNQKQVAQAVNIFNSNTLEANIKILGETEQIEFIQKLELSKFKDKYFYQKEEIKKIQLLPIKFENSKSGFNDIYGLVDLEISNNTKYNIYYKYLYQVVIYGDKDDKPIILEKRPLFEYSDLNVNTELLLKKANILTPSGTIDSFIYNYFNLNYKYNTHAKIINNSINDFFIKYDSKKINKIEQLDAFELKSNVLLYNKFSNLKINFTKSKIKFNAISLPPYNGQKESEINDLTPKFEGRLQLNLNEYSITIMIKFEPDKIIIPEAKNK